MSYSQNPPPGLQLVQDHTTLLSLDGVDSLPAGEAAAELDHTLGQTDLSQAFVTLILREALGGLSLGPVILLLLPHLPSPLGLGIHRSIIDDLVIDGLIGSPERGIIYG